MHTLKNHKYTLSIDFVNNETNNATTEQIPKAQSYQANHKTYHNQMNLLKKE